MVSNNYSAEFSSMEENDLSINTLGGVNIHDWDDNPFRRACEEGHLLVAQ